MESELRLFIVRLELVPDSYNKFSEWFEESHAASLMRAGFRVASSFRSLGTPQRVFNIHEIDGVKVFDTDTYKHEIASDSEFQKRIKYL